MMYQRRRFLASLTSLGLLGPALLGKTVDPPKSPGTISPEEIQQALDLLDLKFTQEERKLMVSDLAEFKEGYRRLRQHQLGPEIPPAVVFAPRPQGSPRTHPWSPAAKPFQSLSSGKEEELAFASIRQLGAYLRAGKTTSIALTRLALKRLKKLDPLLHFVITLTGDLALKQAARADEEFRQGKARGPLHGIPYGAKDLLDTSGIRTTWGAMPYKDRVPKHDATVIRRLEEAGAVLVAKLTLGALAMGDRWFGGRTRNPWKPTQGSSGSSAGPASAVAAGCVPFAIGSETLGSIISPCTRCGATGLRPTFGRVSRAGAMPLSWTMDKLGPITRHVRDAALVLSAIQGPDGQDESVAQEPLPPVPGVKLAELRIGVLEKAFERNKRRGAHDRATLGKLRELGARLVPLELPSHDYRDLLVILDAEAATAFDQITRDGRVRTLVSQGKNAWPNTFRTGHLIPAVEYLRAMRLRSLLMKDMQAMMSRCDVLVAPSFSRILVATNLSGHPALVLPNGFRPDGTPTSITFVGRLFEEPLLVAVGAAYQEATSFHLKHPPLP